MAPSVLPDHASDKHIGDGFLQTFPNPDEARAPSVLTDELFRARLDEQINMKHPLARPAGLMS